MERDYLAEFRQKYYEPERRRFLDATSLHLQNHAAEIIADVLKGMERCFSSIARVQERLPIEVGAIYLSLMESSVYLKKPVIRIEAFDENGIFGKMICSSSLDISWLFTEWEAFRKNLMSGCEEMYAERYIHQERIRTLMFETLEYLTIMAAVYLKYVLIYADRIKGFKKLDCAQRFTISLGRYYDWQKVLYCQDKEVDIFFNPEKKALTFQKYYQKVYHDKVFENVNLSYSRFNDCKFIRCRFEASCFNDVAFEDCVFDSVVINDTTMYGASFVGCDLKDVDFSGAKLLCTEFKEDEFYQSVQFIDCETTQALPV